MDWEFFGVVATLTSATVVLSMTYVIAKRIMADTQRRMISPREETPPEPPDEVRTQLVRIEERLEGIEARLDFTERLLEAPEDERDSTR